MVKLFTTIFQSFFWVLDFLTPLGDLAARVWVASIFFKAGWLKVISWQSTLMLFTHEFSVPFLSPTFAAVIGTGAELLLPILLVLGLGSRISVVIFFIYNVMAIASYPYLWTPSGAQGLAHHVSWGLLLALLMFHGPGKLSLDYWLRKKYRHYFVHDKHTNRC